VIVKQGVHVTISQDFSEGLGIDERAFFFSDLAYRRRDADG
jgi:hypothetical protein